MWVPRNIACHSSSAKVVFFFKGLKEENHIKAVGNLALFSTTPDFLFRSFSSKCDLFWRNLRTILFMASRKHDWSKDICFLMKNSLRFCIARQNVICLTLRFNGCQWLFSVDSHTLEHYWNNEESSLLLLFLIKTLARERYMTMLLLNIFPNFCSAMVFFYVFRMVYILFPGTS